MDNVSEGSPTGHSGSEAESFKAPSAIVTPEQGEQLNNTAFTLHFDKEGLRQIRDTVKPEGRSTVDTILQFPDELEIPKGITLIVGPNGSGKSTMPGLIDIMGRATIMERVHREDEEFSPPDPNSKPYTWEDARDVVIEARGMPSAGKAKRGIAPEIAKYVTVTNGGDNIAITRRYNIPEIAGKELAGYEDQDVGELRVGHKGVMEYQRGEGVLKDVVIGSTQQIIDQRIFGEHGSIDMDLKSKPDEPQMLLLDEPTSNADLSRSMNFLHELSALGERNGGNVNFVVATNEGLLALHRKVPRTDMSHPERGVHKLQDYPLEQNTLTALQEMGYAPVPPGFA